MKTVFRLSPGCFGNQWECGMKELIQRYKVVLIVVGVLTAAAGGLLYAVFYGPNDFAGGGERVFTVWRGQSFGSIVDSLEHQHIVRDRALFIFVARVYGGTQKIRIGRYHLESGISNSDLYLSIREGWRNDPIVVSLPEGMRSRTIAKICSRQLGVDSLRMMTLIQDSSFAHSVGVNEPGLEGYLLPDTYRFFWQTDEKDIITRMVREFHAFYNDSLKQRAAELGWTTNQVVTLASIIEGEAVLHEERATISGVYHNRLRKGMRLEADPTIQFIIPDGPRRILYSDLKLESPYNTYRNFGLPPGPVNNPGKESIIASLYPDKNRYLFFVANGQGGHWFSATYDEHLRRVRQFRRDRRRRQAESLTQVAVPG